MTKILVVILSIILLIILGFFIFSKLNSATENANIPNNAVNVSVHPTYGKYLTDSKGHSLYTYDKDAKNKSNCKKDCEKTWKPFYTKAKEEKTKDSHVKVEENKVKVPQSRVKIHESNVNIHQTPVHKPIWHVNKPETPINHVRIIHNDNGSSQYSYKGRALYHYNNDKNPGDTNGHNKDNSWHLARP